MNHDRLRSVGPWKDSRPKIVISLAGAVPEGLKESLTEGDRDTAGRAVRGPRVSASGEGAPNPDLAPSVNDPIFSLVAEMIDAQAEHLEAMTRMLNGQAQMLREDAERVRRLG